MGLRICGLFFTLHVLWGCQKLDPFLFNGLKLESYQLTRNSEFPENSEYEIPSSQITEYAFQSEAFSQNGNSEASARLYGIWIEPQTFNQSYLFYCHGNKQNLNAYQDRLSYFYRMGFRVFSFDYRGYGKSEGKSQALSLSKDVQAAWAFFKQKVSILSSNDAQVEKQKIWIYGFSLGAFACLQGLSEYTASFSASLSPPFSQNPIVVLEAPFSSAQGLIHSSSQMNLSGSFFLENDFDNTSALKTLGGLAWPVLFLHGIEDHFISLVHSKELLRYYHLGYHEKYGQSLSKMSQEDSSTLQQEFRDTSGKVKTKLLQIRAAGHSSIPQKWTFEAYFSGLQKFANDL